MDNFFENYTQEQLYESFDYVENFIASNVDDWSVAPETTVLENKFSTQIKTMSNEDFSILLMHTGYIPEIYPADSSQETLYSKMIESITCEWARRIGFEESYLQTQKSNKEDVTIKSENHIIVCDAKSFRLGRSQPAPNVKDTIKKQAYITWLEQYPIEQRVGGIVTFPSLHDWQEKSEAYAYFTSNHPPIMLIFYEHMAFMLMNDIRYDKIIDFLKNYNSIYPESSKSKTTYWNGFYDYFLKDKSDEYDGFQYFFISLIENKVDYSIKKLNDVLTNGRNDFSRSIEEKTFEELKTIAINALYNEKYSGLEKQRDNIIKFRKK